LTARSSAFISTAWGQKGGACRQAIGRSRGGLTTKIVALVDAHGNLARFVLLPGQRHDSVGAPDLIEGIDMQALLTDKGFANNRLRQILRETQTQAVIAPKADRKDLIPCDFAMYRWRHLVENFFCDLKQFRGIATRYDKTDESFAARIFLRAIHLAIK
jgi:transposase